MTPLPGCPASPTTFTRRPMATAGDSQWLDLLTAYDGEEIEYDAIGNPESYYNGTRWTFDWEKGRQLVSAESSSHDISYTYGMAGIRDSKTVDGVTYSYYTLSGKVMRQTWTDGTTTHTIDFTYDNAGNPYSFKYNGAVYYYVLNQQGDVIRIVNASGVTQAQYTYNAWGKLQSSSGTLANVNPLRYRSYYYAAETGFYYLQSRYYDPSIGRFINADSFASTGQGFLGYNMFAYCNNNPGKYQDPHGCSPEPWQWLASGALVVSGLIMTATGVGGVWGGALIASGVNAIVGSYSSELTGGSTTAGWFGGAVSGGICGTVAGYAGKMLFDATSKVGTAVMANLAGAGVLSSAGGAVGGVAGEVVSAKIDKRSANYSGAATSGAIFTAYASMYAGTGYVLSAMPKISTTTKATAGFLASTWAFVAEAVNDGFSALISSFLQ